MITRKPNTVSDYESAIRKHRQNVFNDDNGHLHERAIIKLKASKVMQAVFASNKAAEEQRRSDRMLSMYA